MVPLGDRIGNAARKKDTTSSKSESSQSLESRYIGDYREDGTWEEERTLVIPDLPVYICTFPAHVREVENDPIPFPGFTNLFLGELLRVDATEDTLVFGADVVDVNLCLRISG